MNREQNARVYAGAAGQCFELIRHLRESINELLGLAEPTDSTGDYMVLKAQSVLGTTEFADKEFNEVYFPERDQET